MANYPGTLYTTSTSTSLITSDPWNIWASQITTEATTQIWVRWASNNRISYGLQSFIDIQRKRQPEPRVRTAQEIREQDERLARQAEELRAASRRAKDAFDRAEGLLLSHLTKTQREDYKKHKYICFKVKDRTYRLRAGTNIGNVELINAKKEVTQRYCAHPIGVPLPDSLLTQMFHLRHHEEDFLRIANRH